MMKNLKKLNKFNNCPINIIEGNKSNRKKVRYRKNRTCLSQEIAYDSPNHQQPRQNKTKRSSFEQILQEQLKGQQLEENQTFQLYC